MLLLAPRGSSRLWAAALLGLLLMGTLLPCAQANYRSIFDLPSSPVAGEIRAGEPTAAPGARLLDPVAGYQRGISLDQASAQHVTLDVLETLNAIALSTASGIPFGISELTDRQYVKSRTSAMFQDLQLVPRDIAAAITLGMPPSEGSLYDLMSYTRAFRTRDVVNTRSELPREETLAGLALLANGLSFDPHALVQYTEQVRGGTPTRSLATSRPDPLLTQTTRLPFGLAIAAAGGGFRVATPVDPLALADFVYNNSDRGQAARAVDLPVETSLLAIALHNNGVPVAARDLMSTRDVLSVQRVDTIEITYDLADTFSALVIGARA